MNAELSCSQCRDALVELTAGILSTAARQAVERHLTSCPDCQRERDNLLALGGAIRESGQHLSPDGGFATGLVRLRAALALQRDDFTHPEGEHLSMEHDPQSTGPHSPTALPDADLPPTATVPRWRSYQAIAATLTLVLVSALVFGTFASRAHFGSNNTATATSTPTPISVATSTPTSATNTDPQAVPPLANGASDISISMVSTSDGWAIANAFSGDTSTATLLHYSNGRWTPTRDTYQGVYLSDISMDAHDDGWAVGSHSGQSSSIVVLHYSGGRWSQVQTSNLRFAGARVWAFSPSQALVLARIPKDNTGASGSALERYDNGVWTETIAPKGISDMSLISASDFWASCWDGHILHYLSGQWTTYTVTGQNGTPGQDGQPLSISMVSDSDGWIGGFINANPQGMFVAHFNGHTWTRVPGPDASSPANIWAMSLVSPTEGWAGGDLGVDPLQIVLLHYIHGQWQTASDSYSGTIGKFVMISPTEGWATVNSGSGGAGLLHYLNGNWAPYNPNA